MIEGADMVLNAMVGSAGLEASLAAQEMGIPLALANKESLVVGGDLLRSHLEKGLVIPVDSEHSTVFRCLSGEARPPRRILLTASGGALRDTPLKEIHRAPVEKVLAHPNWSMGSRITVDSATMVNKAFEVIEARRLFPGMDVGVVMHPESIVHSLVETADGAWKALMGLPDMKVPISFALHWPDLPIPGSAAGESPTDWGTLSFRELDECRYPAFAAVLDAFRVGGTAPAAANAADEEAVKAFLNRRIPFGAIAGVIAGVVREHHPRQVTDYETLLEADAGARAAAGRMMEAM
jgi:1-deoxy-D-xylulose-5-phosphate reductoisomerase